MFAGSAAGDSITTGIVIPVCAGSNFPAHSLAEAAKFRLFPGGLTFPNFFKDVDNILYGMNVIKCRFFIRSLRKLAHSVRFN